jgi:hypothetical protein
MITKPSKATVSRSLSRALAGRKVSAARMREIVKSVSISGAVIKRIDICAYGICLDFFTRQPRVIGSLLASGRFGGVEVFPFGIVNPDLFLARAQMRVPELFR